MPLRKLQLILEPRSVAVIGATPRENSVGRSVFMNVARGRNVRGVYPVNPKHQEIDGLRCFASIAECPKPVDLAVICTPAATVPQVVKECGEAGIRGIVIISAGFRETGEAGRALEAQIRSEMKHFPGMRIVGPNCLGFMAPHRELNVSFVDEMPLKGNVAFVSQSGALCSAVLDWANEKNIGFSHFVSMGNMLDVGMDDLLDYLLLDPYTESIILYAESIFDARRFMSAARAFTRNKPIIAYKAGRFAESALAAASHTGAMAGVDAVYEAAFARAGIVRVFELEELFDCAELLARQRPPEGRRLGIVTNAGGPGVMATDALLARQGRLATLTDETIARLSEQLPSAWSHGNPIDILGDATPERFGLAVATALADPNVDGLLVLLSPQAMTEPTGSAQAVVQAARTARKPVLASWMGGPKVEQGLELFRNANIPSYGSPEKAVRAFMHLVSYGRTREVLYETPREVPLEFAVDRERIRASFSESLNDGGSVLSEIASKTLLEAYGIPVARSELAQSSEEAIEQSRRIGYPVALKVFSPDITHKTDVGGVELNLATDGEVAAAFDRIITLAKECRPDARIEGVTVQPMILEPSGRELILGAKQDPVFGAVLLLGMGGTAAELLQDRALELPPLSERLARRMLESLRSWPLLTGYRGRPAVDVERLVEVLMRFSYLIADNPEIIELDVNPLLATPQGARALDARVVIDRAALASPPKAYSHLAIRPYPEEFVRIVRLHDESEVLVRPIRPEDEPMWHELLGNCSAESIHYRFGHMFKSTTHEMGSRFCFIDYDRELAVVAEQTEQGQKKVIGVARLVADPDHLSAEFAILVGDPWQGRGIGTMLTDYCLDICRKWGIQKVSAQTAAENHRMLKMFQRRGFTFDWSVSPDTVIATKQWS